MSLLGGEAAAAAEGPEEAEREWTPMESGLLDAVVWFRVAGLGLAAVGTVIEAGDLIRPFVAAVALAAGALVSALVGGVWRRAPWLVSSPKMLAADVAIAAGAMTADGWAFEPIRTWQFPIIGGLWVLAAPLTVGIVCGVVPGAVAGGVVAAARLASAAAPQDRFTILDFSEDMAKVAPSLCLFGLFVAAGAGAGALAAIARRAEAQMAFVGARKELSRVVHDGVLQTLAVVAVRSTQPELATLARDSERELRNLLRATQSPRTTAATLADSLTESAHVISSRYRVDIDVSVDPDAKIADPVAVAAVAGAAREALNNAARHAHAERITVYAAPAAGGGVDVWVYDNGCGFDPDTADRRGITHSIIERLAAVAGRADITSRAGEGTEVHLWAS
jgi:signal transduction histidine kinase